MSDEKKTLSELITKAKHRKYLGILEQRDFILIATAFLVPFLSWAPVMSLMLSGSPDIIIDSRSIWYTVHLFIPVILFILAVISRSLTTSILISIAAAMGYLIVGVPYYWNPVGWDDPSNPGWLPTYWYHPRPEYYPPTPSELFSDCSQLLTNLVAPGILGGVFVQFGVIDSAKNDFKELLRRPVAIILLLLALGGSVLLYGRSTFFTFSNPVAFAFLLIGVAAIITVVAFASRNAYGGLVVGFLIGLVYYSVAAAKDPSSEVLAVFSIGIANWVKGAGLEYTVRSAYIAYGLGFFILALWGSIWGVLGKYMLFGGAPKRTEDITEAHIFRDLWSNYFIFGKNTRPEFRRIDEGGTTIEEGAPLTGTIGGPKLTGKWVTYRYLDRKRRYEAKTASKSGLFLEPLEGGKCKVYERIFKPREQEERKLMGEFLDPKPLFDKYKPMWSPFSLSIREYAAKALSPLVIIPIIIGLIFFGRRILDAYAYVVSGTAGAAALWIIVAQAAIVVFLVFYLLRWRRKLPEALDAHPEGALAFLFAGLIIGVLFIFSFYLLSAIILVIRSNDIETFLDFTTNAIVFLLVVTIFTSASTVQILGADNYNVYFYDDEEKHLKPYKNDYDKPQWLRGSHYWVFRFMYFWPFELTPSLKGFSHEDFERVEIWVNAETGMPEWSISDYHWRELWYRIPDLNEDVAIQVSFNKNFHTPSVSVIRSKNLAAVKYDKESFVDTWKALFHYMGVSRQIAKQIQKPPKVSKKRAEVLAKFFVDLPEAVRLAAANTMASYPWNFFRFPKGVSSTNKEQTKYVYREPGYKPPIFEKVTGGTPTAEMNDGLGSPASVDEESPQLCPKCGKPLAESLVCSNCGSDAKNESFLNVL